MTDPILERIANKDGSLSIEQLIQEVINVRAELARYRTALAIANGMLIARDVEPVKLAYPAETGVDK